MSLDRSWMKCRVEAGSLTNEFMEGVEHFMDFAYNHPQFVTQGTIKCPCRKCELLKLQDRETSTLHLYKWGFLSSYTIWLAHGELLPTETREPDESEEDEGMTENRYVDLVMDAAGPKLIHDLEEEIPNSNAAKFFKLLQDVDKPLWEGCKNHTRLSAVSQLMNCKSECNMSASCYNRVTSLVKSMLPEDEVLPNDFYQSKKMLKELVLAYEKIHACPNDCMLYWKEYARMKECMVCGEPRFKRGKRARGGVHNEVPLKVLPIAFRDMLPKAIWDSLTELSHYFRDICSTVMQVKHLETLEMNIVETLCKLEKIFPPSFFDSMEHLPIHLAYEAKVGGPVQYRWMYPFERCMMNLKRKVRNRACIEGSICEAYLIEETSYFCSLYFEPHVQTKLTRVPRNDDGGDVEDDSKLSIFRYPCRPFGKSKEICLEESDYKAAERYVLLNCREMVPFVEEFDNLMLTNNPNLSDGELDQLRDKEFTEWVKRRVCGDMTIDKRLHDLCGGPSKFATYYNSCFVNGYKFHTKEYGEHKATINSGVCIKGSCYNDFEKAYFGTLISVIQMYYVGMNRITLFKCIWYDPEKGVKVDGKHGLVEINSKSRLGGNDLFVLAEQAQQVYYTMYPGIKRNRSEWWAVCKTKARSTYNLVYEDVQDDEMTPLVEGFYQEDEMPTPIIVNVDDDLDELVGLPTTEVEDVGPADVLTQTMGSSTKGLDIDDEDEFEDNDTDEEEDNLELSDSDSE